MSAAAQILALAAAAVALLHRSGGRAARLTISRRLAESDPANKWQRRLDAVLAATIVAGLVLWNIDVHVYKTLPPIYERGTVGQVGLGAVVAAVIAMPTAAVSGLLSEHNTTPHRVAGLQVFVPLTALALICLS